MADEVLDDKDEIAYGAFVLGLAALLNWAGLIGAGVYVHQTNVQNANSTMPLPPVDDDVFVSMFVVVLQAIVYTFCSLLVAKRNSLIALLFSAFIAIVLEFMSVSPFEHGAFFVAIRFLWQSVPDWLLRAYGVVFSLGLFFSMIAIIRHRRRTRTTATG